MALAKKSRIGYHNDTIKRVSMVVVVHGKNILQLYWLAFHEDFMEYTLSVAIYF